jgi:agmatine/peptidylarginine deiminase
LLNPQRNGELSVGQYEKMFRQALGVKQLSVLEHGHLEGDDTDGHVDTLVRFTPNNGLVIQSCYNRTSDSHFEGLSRLVDECRTRLPQHDIFELPLPRVLNEVGERLPASYANYLINNGQILCPTYGEPEDSIALQIIAKANPKYDIVAIDSLPLIQQFGSVHCISMQVPKGTLKPNFLALLSQDVTIYDK